MDHTARAQEIFRNDAYATRTTGIEITHAGDHEATCRMELDERHRNARGAAMGGALYTLADFAAAVAANSDELESGDLRWVSLDGTIHYLSPAMGNRLTARCEALKVGRTTALYQTTVCDGDSGRQVAIVETTMVRV